MYESFRVSEFRCFEDLEIKSARRVNVIAGKNNAGKSSLLEALFLHGGGYNPGLSLRPNLMRGLEGEIKFVLRSGEEMPWDSLFRDYDTTLTIELDGKSQDDRFRRTLKIRVPRHEEVERVSFSAESPNGTVESSGSAGPGVLEWVDSRNGGNKRKFRMSLDVTNGITIQPAPPPAPFRCRIVGTRIRTTPYEEAEFVSAMFMKRRESVLTEILKALDPSIQRVFPLARGGKSLVYADTGSGAPRPLVVMGEGLARIAGIVGALSDCEGGVLLIDEVETCFHHTVLSSVWAAIRDMSKEFHCQVFATTHSAECIEGARKSFSNDGDSLCLYRLDKSKYGRVESVRYSYKELTQAVEIDLEVR